MIIVVGRGRANELLASADSNVKACISLIDNNGPAAYHPSNLFEFERLGGRVLRLRFDDVTLESCYEQDIAPGELHVTTALAFQLVVPEVKSLARDPKQHLLIHCAAGMSRSPAVCLALFADRARGLSLGTSTLTECAELAYEEMLEACENAPEDISPNRLVVEHADKLLAYGGKLVEVRDRLKGW